MIVTMRATSANWTMSGSTCSWLSSNQMNRSAEMNLVQASDQLQTLMG